jgi:hypothetical protein
LCGVGSHTGTFDVPITFGVPVSYSLSLSDFTGNPNEASGPAVLGFFVDRFVAVTPEPGTAVVVGGLGLVAFMIIRRRVYFT